MSGEDTVGALLFGAAVVWGGYWAYTHYEIKKREPIVAAAPDYGPRPAGLTVVDHADDGAIWQVDASTVRGGRAKRQGWTIVDNTAKKDAASQTSRALLQVDCDSMAIKQLASLTYDKTGAVLSSEMSAPEKADVRYFPPSTHGATVAAFLCDHRFDKPYQETPPPVVSAAAR